MGVTLMGPALVEVDLCRLIALARSRTPSPQTLRVLAALATQPDRRRYGYELGLEVGLGSGSLYPILFRLAEQGLVQAEWEAGPSGRPPRHLYRLTALGVQRAIELGSPPSATTRRGGELAGCPA